VSGFSDAEGCFSVIISKRSNLKWRVIASYESSSLLKDIEILYRLKDFFGVGPDGAVKPHWPNRNVTSRNKLAVYRVTAINDLLTVIIPHFSSYPLFSQKNSDFQLWTNVIYMMSKKQHLDQSGFLSILSYYASINRGMSSTVKLAFPDIIPVERPIVLLPENLNPYWVSGFVAGDGGFSLGTRCASDRVYFRLDFISHNIIVILPYWNFLLNFLIVELFIIDLLQVDVIILFNLRIIYVILLFHIFLIILLKVLKCLIS
jgi:hypothetical protein